MPSWFPDLALGVIPIAAWLACYGAMLMATRPHAIRPVPATPDLGPEPPAVASMFANGWHVTVDAVESTLLDLGARRIIEFRQPADDPRQTTIHVLDERPTGLSPYEQRVFDRVAGLAVGPAVPLTALTFRDPAKAKAWWKRVRTEVLADARVRGLSQRRFTKSMVSALMLAAAVVALPVAVMAYRLAVHSQDDDPSGAAFTGGFLCFLLLSLLAARPMADRDTPAGREAAARWLGVRDWLHGHEAFAELPPAAVAVWDRYLPYGAALGTTRTASAVIDIGMGDQKRPWSSYGGVWHRVRVRYPRFWPWYGKTAPVLAFRALLALGAGYLLVRWWRSFVGGVAQSVPDALGRATDPLALVGVCLGIALIGFGVYAGVHMVLDRVYPAKVTGQVLWVALWQSEPGAENSPPRPLVYYLAVDDGTDERTTAWAMPVSLHGRCDTGDLVSMTARRWSRRIDTLTVIERGTRGHQDGTGPDAAVDRDAPGASSRVSVGGLLTVEEVTQALGMAATAIPMTTAGMAQFTGPDGEPVLMIQVITGTMSRLAARMAGLAQRPERAVQVPGVGDEAWVDGDRAVARVPGATMVALILMGDARGHGGQLPGLLRTLVSRLLASRTGAPARADSPT